MRTGTAATWSESKNFCALSDEDRHLGHIVRAGEGWLAFDATHLNEQGSWFLSLGFYPEITVAKEAVEEVTRHRQVTTSATAFASR
jgi:hypothetical protein